MYKTMVIFGTRPEAIKLFPVINALKAQSKIACEVLVTAQHREMLDQVLAISGVVPDHDLDIMQPGQSLDGLTARLLEAIGNILDKAKPDRVIVQGDTATAMVAALAAYYRQIPVSHVEAGLRSHDIYRPWPEEVNRKIVGAIADQHFAPTAVAAAALKAEAVPEDRIFVTGNTVIDALHWVTDRISHRPELAAGLAELESRFESRKIIGITTHRRENFGDGMESIAAAIKAIAERNDVACIFPVHMNPNVRAVMDKELGALTNVAMIEPLDYPHFARLLSISHIMLTDSGGVQEEAPALGKPVLVMRDTTERPEGVTAGTAKLIGTDKDRIVSEIFTLLDDDAAYSGMARAHNPFGDGKASQRIAEIIWNASRQKPDVCVVGLGYIGLPTAAVIARSGCKVLGVDVNAEVVETINRGEIHIEEVDLDGLVQGVVARQMLRASTTFEPADVFVIAVPTPFHKNHAPDIRYVLDAATNIAGVLKQGDTIILESTSPVGTTDQLRDIIAKLRPDLKVPGIATETADISIAYCPERVLPGRILEELTNNDRSIGGITPRCARKALTFYKRFVRGECVVTDARSAEMTKLVENAFRDVNIAFANELSIVADHMDLDVWEVIRLANRHPRVNILQPGPGVGGHCIAVDPWFIVHGAPDQSQLIRTARQVNDGKVSHVIARASAMIGANPAMKVGCLGLAFKANIDDFRESPAMKVACELASRFGNQINIVEPYAASLPTEFDGTGATLIDIDTALLECEILITLVDHDAFKAIPLAERAGKLVYDVRGIWHDQPPPYDGDERRVRLVA